jgi:hypothetical protein
VCIEVPLVLVERRNINLNLWVKIDSCLISLHRLLLEAYAFTLLYISEDYEVFSLNRGYDSLIGTTIFTIKEIM